MFAFLLLCICLKTHDVTLAGDTISADQSISGDQTLVSSGGKFELGFFRPGNTSNYYIGIWFHNQAVSVRTIVWVANRQQPLSDTKSSVFRIQDGNLVLFHASQSLVWSTNVTSTTVNMSSNIVEAVLLDDGNLVLRNYGSSSLDPLWQSFDHPANTWLLGSKLGFNNNTKQTRMLTSWKNDEDPAPGLFSLQLDPNGTNSLIIMLNRSRVYWSSGPWDDRLHAFGSSPQISSNNMFNYSYVSNGNESYFTYSVAYPDEMSRLLMWFSGQLRKLAGSSALLVWAVPNVYAYCGAFSTYSQNSSPSCTCLSGFKPKLQREWVLQDYSGGCLRTSLNCMNGTTEDQFIQMASRPLSVSQQLQQVGTPEDCASMCMTQCDCTAYAYSYTTGCNIWTGDILEDGTERTLYIRVPGAESKNRGNNKRLLVIALVSAVTGVLALICSYIFWKRSKRKTRKPEWKFSEITTFTSEAGGMNDSELPLFDLKSILSATEDFSVANKLGEGGFGPVYKGTLPGNQTVAIKMLSKKSGQGHQEFMNELNMIAKLQHTNLVRLLGCCIEEEERILIYEYMANRSLDKFLFDPSEKLKLDWNRRVTIIEGIAQGLLYIHKYSRLKVIHRDLKASNVLLDEAMNPKISDFGIARIFDINQTEANTNRVVGTYGYMSPEYARYGHFSEKSDVFSFGVLLLEIISGKKNAALHRYENSLTLAGWAWKLWKKGRRMEVIDETVREACWPHEALSCLHVGLLCVQEDPADRPTMFSVVHMLQADESTTLPPFKEPAFSTHKKSIDATSSSSKKSPISSTNELTVSILECR